MATGPSQRTDSIALYGTPSSTQRPGAPNWTKAFYWVLLVGCTAAIGVTCWHYPLFPFRLDSLAWATNWLLATCVDYWGAALCLSGVILASERFPAGPIWVAGCLLLGSPVCCLWVLHRLHRHGTLGLAGTQ
uniref:Uncharacterized protein n=1 Tax=Eutreptiella gymnastica TaxID=73025 RepID=A0A7S1J163_9EUGL